jgi:hypothetical protein
MDEPLLSTASELWHSLSLGTIPSSSAACSTIKKHEFHRSNTLVGLCALS